MSLYVLNLVDSTATGIIEGTHLICALLEYVYHGIKARRGESNFRTEISGSSLHPPVGRTVPLLLHGGSFSKASAPPFFSTMKTFFKNRPPWL